MPPCALFSALITMPVPFYAARWLKEEGVCEQREVKGRARKERERANVGEMDKGKYK